MASSEVGRTHVLPPDGSFPTHPRMVNNPELCWPRLASSCIRMSGSTRCRSAGPSARGRAERLPELAQALGTWHIAHPAESATDFIRRQLHLQADFLYHKDLMPCEGSCAKPDADAATRLACRPWLHHTALSMKPRCPLSRPAGLHWQRSGSLVQSLLCGLRGAIPCRPARRRSTSSERSTTREVAPSWHRPASRSSSSICTRRSTKAMASTGANSRRCGCVRPKTTRPACVCWRGARGTCWSSCDTTEYYIDGPDRAQVARRS
jgi:hypothetical protein